MAAKNPATNVDEMFKVPPHSLEAEQSVLGGLMLSDDVLDDVVVVVNVEDFYTKQHQVIFEAIINLSRNSKPYDLVAVVAHLSSVGQIETAGDKTYLAELVKNTPGAANILYYSQIVRDKSILRKLIQAGNEIAESGYFPKDRDIRQVLDGAEQKINKIAEHGEGKERQYKTMDVLLESAINKIDELFNTEGTITGQETHLTEFDEITAGLQAGDLIIVAGRPSMGKTTFSMNLAENVATKNGTPIAVFSMEMPGEALAMRMISSIGRIDSGRMRTGKLTQEDWPKLNKAVGVLSKAKVYIDDTPALMITELRARARRIDKDVRDLQRKEAIEAGHENPDKHVTGLGLVVVDYLQLMRGSANAENRVNEISEISRGLKALAKELNIPVIALSQLNRSLEQRPNKRPVMSDLRESGAIEQDADLIIFIYRDEVYNPDTEDKGTAEIILGKHRNGSLGTVRLTFIGAYTRFENHAAFDVPDESY
ncbi:replicative DNA helicase [Thiomicrorhabdus sediminis]|uniref:Replicative DNA helicase n=1 Tax=Thiomicrorhabdus sediminis TaxID=2580412 RepID=A0A4P9K5I4_9GAMM|nr:replicative DNA helicase [Thiomicrorhabdus sediminis]QCU90118.1 replicative DNA helicase [Thiomicrorhabdus sediminis]